MFKKIVGALLILSSLLSIVFVVGVFSALTM